MNAGQIGPFLRSTIRSGELREAIEAKIAVLERPEGDHIYARGGIHAEVSRCGACATLHTLRWVRAALAAAPTPALDVERLARALRAIEDAQGIWWGPSADADPYLAKASDIAREYAATPEADPQ